MRESEQSQIANRKTNTSEREKIKSCLLVKDKTKENRKKKVSYRDRTTFRTLRKLYGSSTELFWSLYENYRTQT